MTGRLDSPTFNGHVKGTDAEYGSLYWDELEGDLTYSATQLHLIDPARGADAPSADIELAMTLDNWASIQITNGHSI